MSERPSPDSITVCTLIWLYHQHHYQRRNKLPAPFLPEEDTNRNDEDHNILLQSELEILLIVIEELIMSPSSIPYVENGIVQESSCKNCKTHDRSKLLKMRRLGGATRLTVITNAIVQAATNAKVRSREDIQYPTAILTTLMDTLEALCDSVDSMVDFFESISSMVTTATSDSPVSVDRTSSHGMYLRKISLGFNILSFECTSRLWRAFVLYVQQGQGTNVDTDESESLVLNLETLQVWPPSPSQVESFMYRECNNVEHFYLREEKKFDENNDADLCNLLPSINDDDLLLLMQHYPENPSVHFFHFLRALHNSERITTYDSLFRYFDYAMIRERRAASLTYYNQTTPSPAASILQYAAVELAAVNWQFGYHKLSQKATQEAIRVAQQYNDVACVAYALGWLAASSERVTGGSTPFNGTKFHPTLERISKSTMSSVGSSTELLQRCIAQAVTSNIFHLASRAAIPASIDYLEGALSERGGFAAYGSSGIGQRQAWHVLATASRDPVSFLASSLSNQRTSSGTNSTDLKTSSQTQDSTNIPWDDTPSRLLSTFGRQHLLSATIWDSFGVQTLKSLSLKTAAFVYGDALSYSDLCLAIRETLDDHGEKMIQHACSLQNPDVKFFTPNHMMILQTKVAKQRIRHSHRGEIHQAHSISTMLNVNCSLSSMMQGISYSQSNEMKLVESYFDSIFISSQAHRIEEARTTCDHLLQAANSVNMTSLRVKVLLMQVQIIFLAQPRHVAVQVLPSLLEAVSLSRRLSLDPLHAIALFFFAQVFLEMGNTKKARAFIKGSLPCIIANASERIQGEAFVLLAKTHLKEIKCLGAAHQTTKVLLDEEKKYRLALSHLRRAIQLLCRIQAFSPLKEAYYLEARLYNGLFQLNGNVSFLHARNEAAMNFKKSCRSDVVAKSSRISLKYLPLVIQGCISNIEDQFDIQ